MKKELIILIGASLIFSSLSLHANLNGVLLAQAEDENFLDDEDMEFDEEEAARRREEERKKREEEERKRREEEERKAEEARRAAIKAKQLKERKMAEAKKEELSGLRESQADTTEYTLDPGSIELVVELDPRGYGFRTRAHTMSLSAELDFILRGRGVLHYDYRFFNTLSFGLLAGIDWTDMSIYGRIRDNLSKPAAKQFTVLGGLSAKWRITEWYMRSSLFLEPSVLFGHMWQTYVTQESTHWRLRPGFFGGVESVFDSGVTFTTRVGVEFPFDFGSSNLVKERVDPLLVVGFGFAI